MVKSYTIPQLYKLLAIGKRELEWSDDYYRLWLAEHGAKEKDGRISATTMSFKQLFAAYQDMRKKGFQARRHNAGTSLRTAAWRKGMIGKLNAMWCELHDLGHVQNRSEASMARWCCNQVKGLERLEWATSHQLNMAIEAMKGWRARLGITEQQESTDAGENNKGAAR